MSKSAEDREDGGNDFEEIGSENDSDSDSSQEYIYQQSTSGGHHDDREEKAESNSSDDDSSENTESQGMSSLERRRQERIRRNQERLASLGLDNPAFKAQAQPKKRVRKSKEEIEPTEIRKSSRSTKNEVNYAELLPRSDRSKPIDNGQNEIKKAKGSKKKKEERLNRFIYDEFCRIKAKRKIELKVAGKRVRSADVEYKFIARKVDIINKKAKRREESGKIGAQLQLEREKVGSSLGELCLDIDRRREELKYAVYQFDNSRMTAEKFHQLQLQRQEHTRKMEMIDAMNRFPTVLKNVVEELNFLLYERSPHDGPPARRGGRKRKCDGEVCDSKKSKLDSNLVESKLQDTEGDLKKLAAVILKEKHTKFVDTADDDLGEVNAKPETQKKIRKRRTRNVGGWVSPLFSKVIDRSWLESDNYESNFDSSTYVPQAGDIVLYYPAGHRNFLEKHPDEIGKKTGNKMRIPLWERAQNERELLNSTIAINRVGEHKWWNDEWLDGVNEHLGIYPLICRVEKTHAEFPTDPDSENTKTIKDDEGNEIIFFEQPNPRKRKKKPNSKSHLCLAVSLKPLSPLMPPVWDASEGKFKDDAILSSPPSFQVVIFPSKCASFVIPFNKAYMVTHSLSLQDKVNWAKESQLGGLITAFTDLGGKYGTFRLDDKKESVSNIVSILKDAINAPASQLLTSLTLSKTQKFLPLPLADAAVVIETLAAILGSKHVLSSPRGNVEIKGKLITLIRGTLPIWNGVTIMKGKRKPSQVSAWDLVPTKVVKKDQSDGMINVSLREHVLSDNGLLYHIDESLRTKLECALEDFMKNNDESNVFWEDVTDDIAPSYSCAVPMGMSFSRVLCRLSCRKSKLCFYRTVASLLDNVDSILDNSILYNSPDSDIVQTGLKIISEAKAMISQVSNQHKKELNTRGKADEERQKKILQQFNSAAILPSHPFNSQRNESKTPRSRRTPRKTSCDENLSPFIGPLERKWIERVDPDGSWHPTESIQNVRENILNAEWVPQCGDFILYSRSLHSQFIRGHHESLTTEQCKLSQFIRADIVNNELKKDATIATPSALNSGLHPNIVNESSDKDTVRSSSRGISVDEIHSSWLLGKIVWVKRVFPRQFPGKTEEKNSISTFDVSSPLLSMGICFDYEWSQKQKIQRIHWRPCHLSCSDESPSFSYSKCSKCHIKCSFLLPAWSYKEIKGHHISKQQILFPEGVSLENNAQFEQPSGLSRDDIASISRCQNTLKRRCLSLIPPDFVDENFTLDNVKKGWTPANKIGQKTLPTFEDEIGIGKSLESERVSNRKLASQRKWSNKEDKEKAIPILAAMHHIPPFTRQHKNLKAKGKKACKPPKTILYEETMLPSPNLCLELVQYRLKNRYYRHKSAIVDDLQEAYVTSTLLVLSKQASHKLIDFSVRKITKYLNTYAFKIPFSTKARKKPKASDVPKNKKYANMSELEIKWLENIQKVRSLYAMAIVATIENVMIERILGTTPKNSISISKSMEEPSTKERYSLQTREKIIHLLSSLSHDPCINRAAQINSSYGETNLGSESGAYPCATLKISSSFRMRDDESEMPPIVFIPREMMWNDNLVRLFFGSHGRMNACARCQVGRRSMFFCRVQRKHYNIDFNWLQQMKDIGGVDGLLFSLRYGMPFPVSSPPESLPSQPLVNESEDSMGEQERGKKLVDLLEKAKEAVGIANELYEEAKKDMNSDPKLSDGFIRDYFPLDPEDGHYTYCSVCGLSGDVICCDKCPIVMHPHCAGLDVVPEGDWFCNKCSGVEPDEDKDGMLSRTTHEEKLESLLIDLRNFRQNENLERQKKNKLEGTQTDQAAQKQNKDKDKAGESSDASKRGSIQHAGKIDNNETKIESTDGEIISEGSEKASLSSAEQPRDPSAITDEYKASNKNIEKTDSKRKPVNETEQSTPVLPPIGIGSKISKQFGNEGFFLGVVRSLPDNEHPFYGIKYEDGDEEDMDENEVRSVLIIKKRRMKEKREAEESTGNSPKRRKREKNS